MHVAGQFNSYNDSLYSQYLNSNYYSAKIFSNELIKKHYDTKETWYILGKVYESLYNYDSAGFCFNYALKYDSTDLKILHSLASAYLSNRNLNKALEVYQYIISVDKDNIDAKVNLANIQSKIGKDYLARMYFVQLVSSDTNNTYFLSQLANCYNSLNESDSAVYYFEKSLIKNPEDFSSVIKLNNLYVQKGAYKKGLSVTKKYLKNDTLNIPVLKLNAYFYFLLNESDSAVMQFSKCLELGDSSFMIMKYLGLAYYKKQDMYMAQSYLNKAYQLDTNDIETCLYYGITLGWTIDKSKGIEYLKKTKNLIFPEDEAIVRVYKEIADLYVAWSKPEEALIYYNKILEYNTDNRLILFKLGSCYENIDKLKALDYYTNFMKTRDPDANQVTINSEGLFVISYYDIAEKRITKLKEELFFEGKLKKNEEQ